MGVPAFQCLEKSKVEIEGTVTSSTVGLGFLGWPRGPFFVLIKSEEETRSTSLEPSRNNSWMCARNVAPAPEATRRPKRAPPRLGRWLFKGFNHIGCVLEVS